eukprot:3341097-Prymnesium_polylepis.2
MLGAVCASHLLLTAAAAAAPQAATNRATGAPACREAAGRRRCRHRPIRRAIRASRILGAAGSCGRGGRCCREER